MNHIHQQEELAMFISNCGHVRALDDDGLLISREAQLSRGAERASQC